MRFLIADGKILEKKDFQLPEEYFDAPLKLSQKMWYGYGGIPLYNENLSLFKRQATALGIPFPAWFENSRELIRLIKRMLNKNRFYRSGLVQLQITAGSDFLQSVISCTARTGFILPYQEEGVLAAFSVQKKYSVNRLNRLAGYNERLWQAALAEAHSGKVHQSVILNENNGICESPFSSLFAIAGNELITPSYESGCYENALRGVVIDAAENFGLRVKEQAKVTVKELTSADEIFCASEEMGMQWFLGIGQQRYIRYYSEKINEEVNSLLKIKARSNPL